MSQLDNTTTIIDATVENVTGIGALLCLKNSAEEYVEFYIDHKDYNTQQKGQKAFGIMRDACGFSFMPDDASEFVGKSVSKRLFGEVGKLVGYRQPVARIHTPSPIPGIPSSANDNDGRYVYVISCLDSPAPLCKIGIATSPWQRLQQLSTSSPFALKIEMAIWADDAAEVERDAHEALAANRKNGEWFAVCAADAMRWVFDLIKQQHRKAA